MMPDRSSDIEHQLAECLRERSREYAAARAALDALEARLKGGEALHRLCPELQRVLAALQHGDARLGPLQSQWRSRATPPGAELAARIEQHQTLLEQTLAIVRRLEETAVEDRARMAPQLDHAARGRRMREAYAAARD